MDFDWLHTKKTCSGPNNIVLHMHIAVQPYLNLHHWTFTLTESLLRTVAEGRRHLQRKKAAQFLVCHSVGAAGNSSKNSSARALKQ